MAKQERNPQRGGSQPITRHPLFPAIIALWFAALFGLGSLLLSTASIEHVVAASGLARTIPMAAPPLGGTARLLVALGLTGIGGLVGVLIGLRLSARNAPRAEAMYDLTGSADADGDEAEPAVGRLPNRRRGFVAPTETVEQAEPESFAAPGTMAPAPASSIFQLSDLDDDDFDPNAFAAPVVSSESGFEPAETEVGEEDEFHDIAARLAPQKAETAPQAPGVIEDEHTAPSHLADAFSPAAWADPVHVPNVEADAGVEADVDDDVADDTEAPVARLFEAYTRSLDAHAARGSATEAKDATGTVLDTATPAMSPAAERIAAASLDDLSHVELLERLAMAMEEQRRKLALAQTSSLSVVPFAAAAAEKPAAIGAHQGPARSEPETVDAIHDDDGLESGTDDHSPAAPSPAAPPPPAPPIAPILQRLSSLGTSAPFAPPPFAPPPFGSRLTYAADDADDAPVQPVEDFASNAPTDSNAIGGWSDGDEALAETETQIGTGQQTGTEPNAPAPVPAALRPVGLTAFDDDDAVPGYIPPRRIAMPAAPAAVVETPDDAGDRPMAGLAGGHDFAPYEDEDEEEADTPTAFGDAEEFAEDGADIVEEDVLDEGYSSLLNLQRRTETRPGLLGLDHAAEDDASAMPMGEASEERTSPVTDEASPTFAPSPLPGARLFDPPGHQDPVETEKALRAALATLQRMSGAA